MRGVPGPGNDDEAKEHAQILRFWRAVEMLDPPTVERVAPRERRYRYEPGRPLPWDDDHPLAAGPESPKYRWRHVVELGVFPLAAVQTCIEGALGRDPDAFDERRTGETALAAFVVSDSGRLLFGSEVLSSCAWTAGRVVADPVPRAGWLAGFETAEHELRERLEDVVGPEPEDDEATELHRAGHRVGRRLDGALLEACLAAAVSAAGVVGLLPAGEIRIRTEPVARDRALEPEGGTFLNGFFAEDLERVAADAGDGDLGAALAAYLQSEGQIDVVGRSDVRSDLGPVWARSAPANVPAGRWPTAVDRPLALGQQLAVNSALAMAPEGTGIVGVNGPPGTGKTTMLRDVIAALVVERARRLAELAHPRRAFIGEERWSAGGYERVVQRWDPALTGFEIVLASSNNGAVENVTDEIPARDAIDPSWHEAAREVDYFTDVASSVLGGAGAPGDAWGLIAARLGKKSHRSAFVQRAWWGTGSRPADLSRAGDVASSGAGVGLHRILADLVGSAPPVPWKESVATFRGAADREAAIRGRRQRAFDDQERRAVLARALADADEGLAAAVRHEQAAQGAWDAARREVADAESDRDRRADRRVEHRRFRPGVLEVVTTLGSAMREWRAQDRELGVAVESAEDTLDRARAGEQRSAEALATRTAEVAAKRAEHDDLERERAEVDARREDDRRALGASLPDAEWGAPGARDRREKAAPWTDAEWNHARSELFLAALELHRAFVGHVPKQMRGSLFGAMDVLTGAAPYDLAEAKALAAWQALFFVVPVVSTTFAAFARMFSHLGRESLGWLLVDEAGQAPPQAAVGALWRTRRAIVVGDPQQLEPIGPASTRIEHAVRRAYDVDPRWAPSSLSAQRLADRSTPLGTWLPDGEGTGRIWVGMPLTVHRRCDEPMFGFVNALAYDGLMVHATGAGPGDAFRSRYPTLPPSKWIDVVAAEAEGHWIPGEGAQLDRILDTLRDVGVDLSGVLVLGPFQDVARQLRRRRERYPGVVAGTVHTAQGKEADVVILVLGGSPQRQGARDWAASRANLVNVAASRAKRRLYVIGDHASWSQKGHFATLARYLPREDPRGATGRRSG